MNAVAADLDPVAKRRLQAEFHTVVVPTDTFSRFCSSDGSDVYRVVASFAPAELRLRRFRQLNVSRGDHMRAAARGQITFRVQTLHALSTIINANITIS
jgi:hypothetical protein